MYYKMARLEKRVQNWLNTSDTTVLWNIRKSVKVQNFSNYRTGKEGRPSGNTKLNPCYFLIDHTSLQMHISDLCILTCWNFCCYCQKRLELSKNLWNKEARIKNSSEEGQLPNRADSKSFPPQSPLQHQPTLLEIL